MLSMIIPCLNESKTVFVTLGSIAKWLEENEIEYEIMRAVYFYFI
jgi:glycosyltransferase involved in cell wall biosynthesis